MKLIMVGMRFQEPLHVKKAIESHNKYKDSIVHLKYEENQYGVPAAVGGNTLIVSIAVCDDRGNKLGHIRNEDVPGVIKQIPPKTLNIYFAVADVETVYQNYWRLALRSTTATATATGISDTTEDNYITISDAIATTIMNQAVVPGGITGIGALLKSSNSTLKEKMAEPLYSAAIPPFIVSDTALKSGYNNTSPKKETYKMNIRDQFFREVNFIVLDAQSGQFGIKSQEGITIYSKGTVSVTPFAELGLDVPAFAIRTEIADLKAGDIIVNGTDAVFFSKAHEEGGYEVVTPSGEVKTMNVVTSMFFGKSTVLTVKNMFGNSGKDGGMNPMMLMLMMGDTTKGTGVSKAGGIDTKTLMLMSMMGGGGKGMDPSMMMMLALMGK